MKFLFTLLVVGLFFSVHGADENRAKKIKTDRFGAGITLKNPQDLDSIIKSGNYGSRVLIKAEVAKVCKQKGCWMALKDDKNGTRVTFKDYSFFVPLTLVGKKVLVEGQIIKKEMSLKETKHYIEDEGGDPSKITKAKTEYRIVASGLEVIR